MENEKICFKSDGTKETGAKIIKALEDLGGYNQYRNVGTDTCSYYLIDWDNYIQAESSIPTGYSLKDIHTWKLEKSLSKEDLLTEAKKKYPIGTKFISSFVENDKNAIRTILPYNPKQDNSVTFNITTWKKDSLSVQIKNGISDNKGCSNPIIYWQGKWAEIVSLPQEKPSKDKPFYVVVTEENKEVLSKWRDFTLKVGNITGLCLFNNTDTLSKQWDEDVKALKNPDLTYGNEITFEQFLELYPECKENVKVKFEVGKWYKNIGKFNFIAKFKEIHDNHFYSDGYFIDDGMYKKSDFDGKLTVNWQNAVECTLPEIQQYLPAGHIDKIVENIVPEYIECINIYFYVEHHSQIKEKNPLEVGKIYKVHHTKPKGSYVNQIRLDIAGQYIEIGCNKNEILYKISTKKAFDLQQQGVKVVEEKVDVLVQTTMSQEDACKTCKYHDKCSKGPHKGLCLANKGQHYPKDVIEEPWQPQVGDWIVSLEDKGHYRKKGDIFQIVKFVNDNTIYYKHDTNGPLSGFRKATKEEIEKATLVYTPTDTFKQALDYTKLFKEEILEIAKEKYKDALEIRPFFSTGDLHTDNFPVEKEVRIVDYGIDCGIGYIYTWNKPGVWAEITKYKSVLIPASKYVPGKNNTMRTIPDYSPSNVYNEIKKRGWQEVKSPSHNEKTYMDYVRVCHDKMLAGITISPEMLAEMSKFSKEYDEKEVTLYKKSKSKLFSTFVEEVKEVKIPLTKEKTSKLITNK